MKRTIFIFAFLSLLTCVAQATSGDHSIKSGYVLMDNDSLVGQIKLSLEHDRLILKRNNENKMITARQIDKVVIGDQAFVGEKFGERHYLFERFVEGDGILVYREGLKLHRLDEITVGPWFVINKGTIKPLIKKKDILVVFGADAKWMATYMKNQDLDMRDKEDVLKACLYYESNRL